MDIKIADAIYTLGEIKLDPAAIGRRFHREPDKLKRLTGISNLRKFDKSKGDIVDRLVSLIDDILEKNALSRTDIKGVFGSGNHVAATLMPTFTTMVAIQAGFQNIISDHVGIGCAGGVQAVRNAYNQLIADSYNLNNPSYYLVIGGEDAEITINQQDYKTASLFSDGCYVLLMTNDSAKAGRPVEYVNSMSLLGDKAATSMTIENQLYTGNSVSRRFVMNGRAVYAFGVKLWEYIEKLCQDTFSQEDLRNMYLIPHQANLRMIEAIVKRYDLNPELVYVHGVQEYGNTSNASAFIGLVESFYKKEKLLVAPFGAELQVGVIVLG